MRTISSVLITEKNKQLSENAWINLVDLQLDDSTYLYITNFPSIHDYYKQYHDGYTGDRTKIRFPHPNGDEYEYIPFQLGVFKETEHGRVENLTATLDNSTRYLEAYLHNYELVGRRVVLRIVNLNHMGNHNYQLTDQFQILSITSGDIVTFSLGHSDLFGDFGRRMLRSCTFKFKDELCDYSGGATTCNRVLGSNSLTDTCKYHGNQIRYGGFPSIKRSF